MKKETKKVFAYITIFVLLVVLVVLLVRTIRSNQDPKPVELFAQCLTDNDVVFYGAFWCQNCTAQKQLLGRGRNHIDYIECSTPQRDQNAMCNAAGITGYPTWENANGERLTGVRSIEELSEFSGCPLPSEISSS